MKKLLISLLVLLVLGGLAFLGYQQYAEKQRQEELARNRKYETSLVKTLKNSYRDIKEIKIENPRYNSQKPGPSWHCRPTLEFSDGFIITYSIDHDLGEEINHSISIGITEDDKRIKLKEYYGKTKSTVLVNYSNGEKGEQ